MRDKKKTEQDTDKDHFSGGEGELHGVRGQGLSGEAKMSFCRAL